MTGVEQAGGMVRWLTVFVDLPVDRFDPSVRFWATVTGSTVSTPRGTYDEFATLLPPDGTPILKVQRVGHDDPRLHLDLHVDDVTVAAEHAADLGAMVLHLGEWVVLASPAGFVHCLVGHLAGTDRPAPFTHAGGATSLVDQLAIDIPADLFAAEVAYWSTLTGWAGRPSALHPEFTVLDRPDSMPFRLLLQRLGEDDARRLATGHLDLAAGADVGPLAAAHAELGAEIVQVGPRWTTLTDPAGLSYCLTIRDPTTGHV